MLCVIESHPVQYHAPVYRELAKHYNLPVTVIYGSDFSIAGYTDREFGATFAWDTDLLSGYESVFLNRVAEGGSGSVDQIDTRNLSRQLSQINPDAIMILGYSPKFHRHAILAALRTTKPLMFRAETSDFARTRSFLKRLLRDSLLKLLYTRFAAFLYIGKNSKSHFIRLGCPENRLYFSPYCVDTQPFFLEESDRVELREKTRTGLGISKDQMVIIFSGKLSLRKGVDVLMEAVKNLPVSIRKKITVIFLGSGELENSLRSEAGVEPTVNVRFAGFQNQKSLSAYYHASDFLVLPSVSSETWGLVVNDALHHGLPCVVTEAVGCAPDLVIPGNTGEICVAGSNESLSDAINRIISWAGGKDVKDSCRYHVSQYTVSEAARGIASAYQNIIDF